MTEGVWVAIIGGLSGIAIAVITAGVTAYVKLQGRHNTTANENKILKIELSCVSILFDHTLINTLNSHIINIFENTKVNRFLILFAVNGKDTVRYVTVCYEQTKMGGSAGAIYRYVRLKIDEHYQRMLKDVERDEVIHLDVKRMQPSILKTIYESKVEKVHYSTVCFLKRIKADENNDIILYTSIATTEDCEFTDDEKMIIKTNVDAIRHEARNVTFTQSWKN